MLFQLIRKDLMRTVIFAYEQRAGGIHVNPVDDPGTDHPIDTRELPFTVIEDSVDKRMAGMPG